MQRAVSRNRGLEILPEIGYYSYKLPLHRPDRVEIVNWNERSKMTTNDDIESGTIRAENNVFCLISMT